MRFIKHGAAWTPLISFVPSSIVMILPILLATTARTFAATFSTVDFSSQANFTWVSHPETDPDGQTEIYFPNGPIGQEILGGVPFNIKSNGADNQAWNAYIAAGGSGETPNNTVESLTIPVNAPGVTEFIRSSIRIGTPLAAQTHR